MQEQQFVVIFIMPNFFLRIAELSGVLMTWEGIMSYQNTHPRHSNPGNIFVEYVIKYLPT